MEVFLKNWKTSLIGVIVSVTGYIATFPDGFQKDIVNVSKYVSVGGLASLGIVAKDVDNN